MICKYCEKDKQAIKIWDKTGELVCWLCRVGFLESEFEQVFGKDKFYRLAEKELEELEDNNG